MGQPTVNERSFLGAWPAFLVAVLLGLGAIWVQTPFQGQRQVEGKGGVRAVGMQDVDARLWQDPFSVAAEARKQDQASGDNCFSVSLSKEGEASIRQTACSRGEDPKHHPAVLSREILARLVELTDGEGARSAPAVTVLGIMVSGAPSVGAAEARRRFRYAALSGLKLEGFLPVDPEHIGYVEQAKPRAPRLIPFEWFSRPVDGREAARALLLLWLNDDSLTLRNPQLGRWVAPEVVPGPLTRLSEFLGELYGGIVVPGTELPQGATPAQNRLSPLGTANLKDLVSFRLIGPASSNTLQAMAGEYRLHREGVERLGSRGDPGCPMTAPIYSPFATIPHEFAVFEQGDGDPQPVFAGKGGDGCVAVVPPGKRDRTIATDDLLTDMLADELQRRHLTDPARVALVGQWDTSYSRELAELFCRSWGWAGCDTLAGNHEIELFNYMRGLDGRIPGVKPTGKGAANGDKAQIERPVGDAQTDYLRRIRDALLVRDGEHRLRCGFVDRVQQRCGIRAIGVLGNDYHDKLLVLQALKPAFPQAVFFTTDLDAAMWHPEDNRYTRNLVVATGYGLTLAPVWQGDIPPLRQSYQTSLLLTVRHALCEGSSGSVCNAISTPPPARLFEIGRTQPVELARSNADRSKDPHPVNELTKHFQILGPPAASTWSDAAPVLALFSALALVGFWLLSPVTPRHLASLIGRAVALAKDMFRHSPGLFFFTSTVALLTLVVPTRVLLLMFENVGSGGEPFSWLEGVSVWPSELLRLAAGIVAVILFFRGHWRQFSAHKEIETDLFPATDMAQTPESFEGRIRCDGLLHHRVPGEPTMACGVWMEYEENFGVFPTLKRIWPGVLLMFGLAFFLMLAFGFPNRPVRSELAWYLDLFVILLVLIPFLGLLFYLVDATRQTLCLAKKLSGPVAWPRESLRRFGLCGWEKDGKEALGRMGVGSDMVWLDVRLIGKVSSPVGDLVWYPVLVLILLAFSRSSLFDAWTLPPALVVVMTIVILIAILCASLLRRAAERVREEAVAELTSALLRGQSDPNRSACVDQLRIMIGEIRDIREGAFRPFSQQPVVQSLLTLLGSVSGLALLEYFTLFNL